MFGKEKSAHIEFRYEDGYHKAIIDYYSVKDRRAFRIRLHTSLCGIFGQMLLLVDSNFINSQMDGKEGPWVEELIKVGETEGLQQEHLKFKRQRRPVFGGLFGGKGHVVGYRYGAFVSVDALYRIIEQHDRIGLGVHYGADVAEQSRGELLKEFCTGMVDEMNFERYYGMDIYDYEMVGRAVLKGPDEARIRQVASRLAEELGFSK